MPAGRGDGKGSFDGPMTSYIGEITELISPHIVTRVSAVAGCLSLET